MELESDECISDIRQVDVNTLRVCCDSRTSITASPFTLLGEGYVDMVAVMVDDIESI
jgi:hypothetical protein